MKKPWRPAGRPSDFITYIHVHLWNWFFVPSLINEFVTITTMEATNNESAKNLRTTTEINADFGAIIVAVWPQVTILLLRPSMYVYSLIVCVNVEWSVWPLPIFYLYWKNNHIPKILLAAALWSTFDLANYSSFRFQGPKEDGHE